MLSPMRSCLDCSKVYCDVREIWFMAWNQNRYVTYYILHIQYTNSEISIGLLYIHPPFVWWQQLNHCHTALSRNFPTSISFHAPRCFLTFHTHTSTILAPLGFTNSRTSDLRAFSFPRCLVLRTRLAWHGGSCRTTSKVLSTSFKK